MHLALAAVERAVHHDIVAELADFFKIPHIFRRFSHLKHQLHHYEIGALLYCPASTTGIAQAILEGNIPTPFSLAFCLEDTVGESFVEEAISTLVESIGILYQKKYIENMDFYLPKIFIRVRNPKQMEELWSRLGERAWAVEGFIAPKTSPESAPVYIDYLRNINQKTKKPCYFMPILESRDMIDLRSRTQFLYSVKQQLQEVEELVASVRVGGNDLCHCFDLRRNRNTSIHEIPVITHLLSDIMAVFALDYPISSAVWEYYKGEHWDTGLKKELEQDRMNGFIGKTVIHPVQIPLVHQAYQVSQEDFNDAKSILQWDINSPTLVSGNTTGQRMNEYKTHSNWAKHILLLAEVYGIKQEE